MNYRKIKSLREEKNMTQSDFAEALGVSDKTINNWERGESPSSASLSRIANNFFGGDMNAFKEYFEGEPDDWDFSIEDSILADALKKGTINPVHAPYIRALFDREKKDAAVLAICSFLGDFRARPSLRDTCFLSEMALMMNRATTFDISAESENLIKILGYCLLVVVVISQCCIRDSVSCF